MAGDAKATDDEFNQITSQLAQRRARIKDQAANLLREERELRFAEASTLYLKATIQHPFEVSKSAPLLLQAAELAQSNFGYWIEAGRAQRDVGDLVAAESAFLSAQNLAETTDPQGRDHSVALHSLGDVYRAQGDLPAALGVYQEGLQIMRDLSAQDPRNADWARDVSVDRKSTRLNSSHITRWRKPCSG